MTRSELTRAAVVAGAVAALTLTWAGPASAHVSVSSASAVRGGYATVTFKVPNESDSAATTKVEVNLPADTPFASVSLRPVPGWTVVAQKAKLATPIEAHGSQISEAVNKITWTATGDAAIKPGQFQTFDVSLGPLPETNQVVFKALQTYSDGEIVRWIEEPAAGAEPEKPAPVLTLAAAGSTTAAIVAAPAAPPVDSSGTGTTLGVIGIALGLAGLIAGLLAYRRTAAPAPVSAPSESVSV